MNARLLWAGLALFPILTGCAWRTSHADYVFGPSLFRLGQTTAGQVGVVQTLHVPVLLEGGRQWGLSIGGTRREAVIPGPGHGRALDAIQDNAPQGIFIHPEPGEWHMSWIYFRAPLRETPVFIRRSVVGLHGGSGVEERAFSLGYSSMTATMPRPDALHEVDFNSRRPWEASAVITPLAELEQWKEKQDPSLNEVQP